MSCNWSEPADRTDEERGVGNIISRMKGAGGEKGNKSIQSPQLACDAKVQLVELAFFAKTLGIAYTQNSRTNQARGLMNGV